MKKSIDYDIQKLPFTDKIRLHTLAIKYYFKGDDWDFAREYAMSIIKGFKRDKTT
jgi:hypothetical protein